MGNSIYLGGGIKSAFCGGNVKEIWQGSNKIFGGGGGDFVRIGEHDYPVVKIGSLIWLARDLYEETTGSCWFKNTPPEEGSMRGRLYKWSNSYTEVENLCPEGWRIPTYQDFVTLFNKIGAKLNDWLTDGTNTCGWNGIVSGTRWHSGTWAEGYVSYWTQTIKSSITNYAFMLDQVNNTVEFTNPNTSGSSLSSVNFRLCKDA